MFEKGRKTWYLALVGLTLVQGTSVQKKDAKKDEKRVMRTRTFGCQFDAKSIQKTHRNKSPQNMELDTKGVPKENRNRCINSSKTNAKTGNEKHQENHQQSCFSEL